MKITIKIKYILFLFILLLVKFTYAQNIEKDSTSYFYLYSEDKTAHQIIIIPEEIKKHDITSYYFLHEPDEERDSSYLQGYIFRESKTIRKFYLGSNKIIEDTIMNSFSYKTPINQTNRKAYPDWIIIIIVLSLAILAWVNFFYNKYLGHLFTSVFNYRKSTNLQEENSLFTGRSGAILVFMYFINISLFVVELLYYQDINLEFNLFTLFIVLFFSFITIFVLKNITLSIFSYIFDIKNIISKYKFNQNLFIQIAGVSLLLFIISIPHIKSNATNSVIYIAFLTLLSIYILKVIRLSIIIFRKEFSLFYLFLYLCTLEILPFFILIKIYILNF